MWFQRHCVVLSWRPTTWCSQNKTVSHVSNIRKVRLVLEQLPRKRLAAENTRGQVGPLRGAFGNPAAHVYFYRGLLTIGRWLAQQLVRPFLVRPSHELLSKASMSGRTGALWRRNRTCPARPRVYSRAAITSHPFKNSPPLFTSKGKADRTWQGLLFLNAAYCQVREAAAWETFWKAALQGESIGQTRYWVFLCVLTSAIKQRGAEFMQLYSTFHETGLVTTGRSADHQFNTNLDEWEEQTIFHWPTYEENNVMNLQTFYSKSFSPSKQLSSKKV